MGKKLDKELDDGYVFLAYWIVSHNGLPTIRQVMTGSDWLKSQVCKDCSNLDLSGAFVDAIVQDLDAEGRAWVRQQLREFGEGLYKYLDKPRLRQNIREILGDQL